MAQIFNRTATKVRGGWDDILMTLYECEGVRVRV